MYPETDVETSNLDIDLSMSPSLELGRVGLKSARLVHQADLPVAVLEARD